MKSVGWHIQSHELVLDVNWERRVDFMFKSTSRVCVLGDGADSDARSLF